MPAGALFAMALGLACQGHLVQGGLAVCTTAPGAEVLVDGVATRADASGHAVIGFDRDAPAISHVQVRDGGQETVIDLAIAPRAWNIQRVDGLPEQTVTPTSQAVLARIARDSKAKAAALTSRAEASGFLESWVWPVRTGRVSGAFGDARVLNGVAKRPHYGVDIADPVGTPLIAPASGTVTFARSGLHYEGGLVFIDHGQGLTSMYLHLSEISVQEGQRVAAGDPLGRVGATGRATGPHVCWRLKWRDRNLDPSLLVQTQLSPVQ